MDQNSCNAIIREDCDFGGRDPTLEAGPHEISDVQECQEYSQNLVDFGFDIQEFFFDAPKEECQVFSSNFRATCNGRGGPATVPESCFYACS